MSFAETIVTTLNADVTLEAILTGGIHNFPDAGRNGLNRIQIPGAFDPKVGLVKPLCIVAEFDETPDGQIVDTQTAIVSTVVQIVTRIYDNGDSGYTNIINAYQRIYKLLAFQPISGAIQILPGRVLKDRRDSLLKDSCYYDLYWTVHGYHS